MQFHQEYGEVWHNFILGVWQECEQDWKMDFFAEEGNRRDPQRRWGAASYLRSLTALIVAALLAKAIGKQRPACSWTTDYLVGRG